MHRLRRKQLQSEAVSRRFRFLVPPLPEQQRIVGILDEAFEGIATAKANAEKNLQNARALFESHLQSVFTQRGKGWVETTIGDVMQACRVERRSSPDLERQRPATYPIRMVADDDVRCDEDSDSDIDAAS